MANKDLSTAFDKYETKETKEETTKGAIKNKLSEKYDKKYGNSQPINETHKRTTVLVQRDLANMLDELSAKEGRGFKSMFINEVIAEGLRQYGYESAEYNPRN